MSVEDYRALVEHPRSKYGNRRVELDGYTFDSKAEAAHYLHLKDEVQRGNIKRLRVHPRYVLQDPFRRNGKQVRAIEYVGDFEYIDSAGRVIVEDVKGGKATMTQVFRVKQKMFWKGYPNVVFRIVER